MRLFCVECGSPLPERPIPPGRLLADGVVLLRLVRGRAGQLFEWGTLDRTAAPAVPICERLVIRELQGNKLAERHSDCIGKLCLVRAFTVLRDPLEPGEGRRFGWASCARRQYSLEYFVRTGLPRAYRVLCGLEERGAVPQGLLPELEWVVPWWREMIAELAGGT